MHPCSATWTCSQATSTRSLFVRGTQSNWRHVPTLACTGRHATLHSDATWSHPDPGVTAQCPAHSGPPDNERCHQPRHRPTGISPRALGSEPAGRGVQFHCGRYSDRAMWQGNYAARLKRNANRVRLVRRIFVQVYEKGG